MLNPKVEAALDAFQHACDLRMATANAANEPTEPLFHYTSEKAVISIVNSQQFWFSSIFHMDDKVELTFGYEILRTLLNERRPIMTGLARTFCEGFLAGDDLKRINELIAFYSVSFGLRDQTEQWADYGDAGAGAALGFTPNFFSPKPFKDPSNPAPEEKIFYGKVDYGEATARVRHSKVIEAAFSLINQIRAAGWLCTEPGDIAPCGTFCE